MNARQARGLLLVSACGALGGGINAWLCYAGIPEPIKDASFSKFIELGGAMHGAILAVLPAAAALRFASRRPLLRLLQAILIGWIAGYLSWIPLGPFATDTAWTWGQLWPYGSDWKEAAFVPFMWFGAVSLIYFLCLSFGGLARGRASHVGYGVIAGVIGSAYWWVRFEPWYFAIIHGVIWGGLVGLGMFAAASAHPRRDGRQEATAAAQVGSSNGGA